MKNMRTSIKFIGLTFFALLALSACGNEEPSSSETEEDTEQVEEAVEEYEELEDEELGEEYEEYEEKDDEPTREQRSAREDAFNYRYHARMSDEGDKIAEKLEADGYPEDAVNYALEELKFDALDSLEDFFFSDLTKGQYERDESGKAELLSGYPKEAKNYAWENISIDYNEQALFHARRFDGSDAQIKEELIEFGFTEEQAQYAIDHLN